MRNTESVTDHLQPAFKEALEFFPQLKTTAINLRLLRRPGKSTMFARPAAASIVLPASRRTYLILVSPTVQLGTKRAGIETLPRDVLIGWFGHELGHIADYHGLSGVQLLLYGIRYLISPSFLRAAEFRADYLAVKHGLDAYILRTKRYILHEADIPAAYKKRIERYYSSPEEIESLVARLARGD